MASDKIVGSVVIYPDEPHSAEWVIPASLEDGEGRSESFSLRMSTHCERSAHCPEGVDVRLKLVIKDGMVSFFAGLPRGTRAHWAQWVGQENLRMRNGRDDWIAGKDGKDPYLGKRDFGRISEHAHGGVLRLGISLLVVTRPGQIAPLPSTRFKFEKQGYLGNGAFGEVRKVTDTENPTKLFCAKTAKKGENSDFSTEAVMMRRLQGLGFAEFVGYFQTSSGAEVLVQQRLDRTLESLRSDPKIGPSGEVLSTETIITIGIQLVRRLRDLHELGFVHNDLKPENIMIDGNAPGDTGDVLYLIDFGLSRHYRIMGRHMKQNTKDYGLIGTIRYCSVYGHRGEGARRSDMESLAHLLIYLAAGSLPWQGLHVNANQDRDALILDVKKNVGRLRTHTMTKVAANPLLAEALLEMVDSCRALAFEAEPNYDEYIEKLTAASTEPRDGDAPPPLDWVRRGTRGRLCSAVCELCEPPSADDCASQRTCNCNINRRSMAEDFYADCSEALAEQSTSQRKGTSNGGFCSTIGGWLCPCLPCQ